MGALENRQSARRRWRRHHRWIPVAHSSDSRCYYYQRGALIVPNEALDEPPQGLGRLGLTAKNAKIEPVGET